MVAREQAEGLASLRPWVEIRQVDAKLRASNPSSQTVTSTGQWPRRWQRRDCRAVIGPSSISRTWTWPGSPWPRPSTRPGGKAESLAWTPRDSFCASRTWFTCVVSAPGAWPLLLSGRTAPAVGRRATELGSSPQLEEPSLPHASCEWDLSLPDTSQRRMPGRYRSLNPLSGPTPTRHAPTVAWNSIRCQRGGGDVPPADSLSTFEAPLTVFATS